MEALRKRRILFLSPGPELKSPWQENGTEIAAGFCAEGWPLLGTNEWQDPSPTHEKLGENLGEIYFVLVDIDAVARTEPLDAWSLAAWRATFNDLVLRATHHSSGRSPLLMGYTREPSWEKAIVGVRIGARDLVKLSRLNEKISELTAGAAPIPAPLSSSSPLPSSQKILTLKRNASEPARALATSEFAVAPAAIPKHVIPFPIDGLDGTSHAIEGIRTLIRRAAPLDTPVLISGATGSGKELVARALHRYSPRAPASFVAVNCGAIAPGLFESELFGHVKGAFTDAQGERVGLLASANGGTLFLDEISELPPEFQVKLLRALQERQIHPVGSSTPVPIDVRLISATQEDLEELSHNQKFRKDLLYRLKVIEIILPALVERKSDIPDLAKTILKKITRRHRKETLELSEAVLEKFLLHTWPGNIREFENVLEHAATLAWSERRAQIGLNDLPDEIRFATMSVNHETHLKEVVRRFEREYIASTVRRLGGSKEHAADTLGLSLATLYRKMGGH